MIPEIQNSPKKLFYRCETIIVRLASKATLAANTPEIFFSGALHGDERLGPNTLLEMISLACHMYGKHPIITYLVRRKLMLYFMFSSNLLYGGFGESFFGLLIDGNKGCLDDTDNKR